MTYSFNVRYHGYTDHSRRNKKKKAIMLLDIDEERFMISLSSVDEMFLAGLEYITSSSL